jgi:hypothetical protein
MSSTAEIETPRPVTVLSNLIGAGVTYDDALGATADISRVASQF